VILAREHPEVLRQKVARPNDIELGGPGPPRAGEPARRKPPWRAGSGWAGCILRKLRAPATLDKAVEMKVNFYPAPLKGWA